MGGGRQPWPDSATQTPVMDGLADCGTGHGPHLWEQPLGLSVCGHLSPLWHRVGCGPSSGLSGGHLTTVRQISASWDVTAHTRQPESGQEGVSTTSHGCPIHAEPRCPPITSPSPKQPAAGRQRGGSTCPSPRPGNHLPSPADFRPVAARQPSHAPGQAGHPRTLTADQPLRASHLPRELCLASLLTLHNHLRQAPLSPHFIEVQ